MSRTIIFLLILNSLSCLVFRVFIHRGRMKLYCFFPDGITNPECVNLFIAGMMNQPFSAFFQLKSTHTTFEVYADYSCFGWNAKNSAAQLDKIRYPRSVRVNVFTVSVGDKIARDMTRCNHIYSIDPCPNPEVLYDEPRRKLSILAIILELLVLLLGWLSVIPFFPTADTPYSLALIADQLWEISINRRTAPWNKGITSIIFSEEDEYVSRKKVEQFYKTSQFSKIIIHSKHARTTDLAWSIEYDNALEKLLQRR